MDEKEEGKQRRGQEREKDCHKVEKDRKKRHDKGRVLENKTLKGRENT